MKISVEKADLYTLLYGSWTPEYWEARSRIEPLVEGFDPVEEGPLQNGDLRLLVEIESAGSDPAVERVERVIHESELTDQNVTETLARALVDMLHEAVERTVLRWWSR